MPESPPLAVQLYTLRAMPGTLEDRLGAVADAGYSAVETVGTHGLDAPAMRAALDAHGLRAVSSHVPLDVLQQDLGAVAAFARAIGNDTVVVPYLPEDVRPADAAGWRRLGRMLDELGARCAARGLRLLYHNHAFEMEELDGAPGIAWLLDAADEAHLGFEPDVAWMARAGADPAALLARYAGRCPRVHVKDLAPDGVVAEDGWAAVGSGVLAWERLLPAAAAAGAEWYVVEHDAPRDPAASIRDSYAYLSRSPALRSPAR